MESFTVTPTTMSDTDVFELFHACLQRSSPTRWKGATKRMFRPMDRHLDFEPWWKKFGHHWRDPAVELAIVVGSDSAEQFAKLCEQDRLPTENPHFVVFVAKQGSHLSIKREFAALLQQAYPAEHGRPTKAERRTAESASYIPISGTRWVPDLQKSMHVYQAV